MIFFAQLLAIRKRLFKSSENVREPCGSDSEFSYTSKYHIVLGKWNDTSKPLVEMGAVRHPGVPLDEVFPKKKVKLQRKPSLGGSSPASNHLVSE